MELLKLVQDRLNRLEKMFHKSERSWLELKRKKDALEKKIRKLEKAVCTNNMKTGISKIFNEDQISLISNYYKKVPCWCNATIIKTLKLCFACGTAGYEELLRQKFLLSFIWTAYRWNTHKFSIYSVYRRNTHFLYDLRIDELCIIFYMICG